MNLYKQKVLSGGAGTAYTVYIDVASFTLEGKLLAELWPRVFFTSLILTGGKFGASACCSSALSCSSIWRLGTGGLHRLYHALFAACTTGENCRARFPLFGFLS